VRVVRLLGRIARGLAYAAAAAALLLAAALYDDGLWIVLALAAAVPACVLFLFSLAVREAAELPQRLRGAPAQVGGLRAAVDDLARARGGRLPGALWRAGRQAASARDLAMPWAPLLPLVNLPFLAATGVSALATPLLVVAALVIFAAKV
jgi:hypothetical protein